MIDRRRFVCVTAAVAAIALARAQPSGRIHRVGYLQTATEEEQAHLTRAFEDAMRELGYVEGRSVVYERRFANGRQEQLPGLAAELAHANVDVIVTGANPVIAAVRQVTSTIPVVMTTGREPVAAGFIASLARPGGNITGLTTDPTPDAIGKDLELFKEAIPRIARVALLWNPVPPAADTYRNAAEASARKLAVSLQVVEVRGRDELEHGFETIARERADGLWVLPDPVTFTARRQVIALAAKHRLPSVFWQREFVDLGGLMSYGSNVAQNFRRAATYVDRILKGAPPGGLAVEQPTKFELVINARTAGALGLAIPQSLLVRADEVVR